MGSESGSWTAHQPEGFAATDIDRMRASVSENGPRGNGAKRRGPAGNGELEPVAGTAASTEAATEAD
jgi:hypothetical protein